VPGGNAANSDSVVTSIDGVLLDFVRSNPGVGFGPIVEAVRGARKVSRATAARHLSRLVRFGDLTLREDRTYVVGEPHSASTRPVVELRWSEAAIIIRSDGSAQALRTQELRVVSGQLSQLEFNHPLPLRRFAWWISVPGRMVRIPAIRSHTVMSMHLFRPLRPLAARDSTWIRICRYEEWPKCFELYAGRRSKGRGGWNTAEPRVGNQSIEIPAQDRCFQQRLSADSALRLVLTLPAGYRARPSRCRVRYLLEPDRIDIVEQARITGLSREKSVQAGLRRAGNATTLTIPRPVLDRYYEIEWTLPTPSRTAGFQAPDREASARPQPRRASPSRR
jgi:hypothetical protein